MRLLFILVAFLAFMPHHASATEISAEAAEIAKVWPPELMYEGKPVDPDCLRAMLVTPSGTAFPMDLATCGPKATRGPNDPVPVNGIVEGDNEDIGYDYTCKDKDCGSFFYRYVGHAEGAMVIASEYTDKDSRTTTSLDLLKREEGDKLLSVGHLTGGERCNGGLAGPPKVTDDGRLLYGFNTTPYGFMARYVTGKERATSSEMTDCSSCCLGRFSMEGRLALEIDFQTTKRNLDAMKRDGLQGCFNKEYQRVEGRTLNDADAKAFAEETIKNCRYLMKYQQFGKE